MPIYAYKCESCGHSLEVLQKMSDAPLSQCPACGAHALSKQVTAAGFQLKGSGWYVTDFRGGSTTAAAAEKPAPDAASGGAAAGAAPAGSAASTDSTPAGAPPSAAPTPPKAAAAT